MRPIDVYSSEAPRGWTPWGALAPLLALLFIVVGVLIGTELIRPFVNLDAHGNPADASALMAFTLVPFALIAGMLLLWVKRVERAPLAAIGLRTARPLRTFFGGHLTGMASMLAIVLVIGLAGGFRVGTIAPAWSSGSSLMAMLWLLPCFALQSGVEELVFRGWLLPAVSRKFNIPVGVAVSSALFALLHFSPGQHPLATFSNLMFAVFCCAWVLRTRNVYGVMGWHAGWNWLLAVGFNLPLTGLDVGIPALVAAVERTGAVWLTGGDQGPEGSVVTVGYFLASIAGIALLWPKAAARANS